MGQRGAMAMAVAALGWSPVTWASDAPSDAADLLGRLHGLRTVGSVLYVAAHPDDENTAFLAWAEGDRHLDATYLSLTRGGGGQNLIGTEQGALLGVLRTGELVAARGVDGASQRFSRARDFGYSKSAEESLRLWGHEGVLDDVVRVFREVRPDVVVTRFGPTDKSHGHHVASAVLAEEAFALAGDPAYVTDGLAPWQPARMVRNQSHLRIDDDTDTSGWIAVDVGTYDAARGQSWGEVAAAARTMHKSQGFGSAPKPGPRTEYFSAVAGDVPEPGEGVDLFDGLVLDWSRYPQARSFDRTLAKAIDRFDPTHPERVLPWLAKAHAQLTELEVDGWEVAKRGELEALMADCAGLWLTARSDRPAVVQGADVTVALTALVRGDAAVRVERVAVGSREEIASGPLRPGEAWTRSLTVSTADRPLSQPHWLVEPMDSTTYTLPGGPLRSAADTPAALTARVGLVVAGVPLELTVPVQWAWTDPVHGERVHDLEVLPPVTATFGQATRLAPAGSTLVVPLSVRVSDGAAQAVLRIDGPPGAEVRPSEHEVRLDAEQPEVVVPVQVRLGEQAGPLGVQVEVAGESSSWSRDVIDHLHVPRRTVLSPASVRLVPVDLDRGGVDRVATIEGPGDRVADSLRDMGYQVDVVGLDALRDGSLDDVPAVLVGIRALNTRPELLEGLSALWDYAEQGGTVVLQYQTSNRWRDLGPLGPDGSTFRIDRDRVTDETAPLTAIDPSHPMLLAPNALTEADFDGWVQERGLYFAASYDDAWTPLFRSHDPGEAPLTGSTLVLRHGEGTVVYTGLSFFRQLPAGVPGAARLFANLLAGATGEVDGD